MNAWSLGAGKNCLSFHVVTENKSQIEVSNIIEFIHSKFKLHQITIQIESLQEAKKLNCESWNS